MYVHAPNLTRYHMKMVLKAFSLEQEPQAMVMSWDIPLGATCRDRNSCGLSSSSTPPPPAEGVLLWAASWVLEGVRGRGRLGGKQGCSRSCWPGRVDLGSSCRGGREAQNKALRLEGREENGKERPSLSLRMHLPPLETLVFCSWEDEVLNDFIRGNDENRNVVAGCMTYANLLSRDKY